LYAGGPIQQPDRRVQVTVALHSGFCVRRQYAAFARNRYGAVVREFLDTLVSRKLAARIA
jgi:hypothetical protein